MGQSINIAAWVLGVIPGALIMYIIFRNRGEPWRVSNLLCSVMLILLSTAIVGLMSELVLIAQNLHDQGKVTDSVFAQLRSSGTIWLVIFPLVWGGVGINVLSGFLLARQPTAP